MISVFNWFSNLKRRRAIKKYAKKLGPILKRDYGKSIHYTPGQIRAATTKAKLSHNHICYAYAMYMDKTNFEHLHQELNKDCDYNGMRTEIGNLCFSGENTFTTTDVISYGGFTDGVGFTGDVDGGD